MAEAALDTHRQAAAKLAQQRERLLGQAWIDAGSVARVERRLRAHVATIAELYDQTGAGEPPSQPAEALVYWLALLLGGAGANVGDLVDAIAADDASGAAAAQAWCLLPAGGDDALDAEAARGNDAVWAAFLQSRLAAGQPPSDAVLNKALNAETESLRCLALAVAADDPQRGAAFFQPWYAPSEAVPHRVAAEAVLAGLVRGDAAAERALSALLEQSGDDSEAHRAVHVMAMAGAPAHRDAVTHYARRNPVDGAMLLAIDGAPSHLDTLIALLERPEAAEAAALAWWRLTGETLPYTDRMRSVSADAGGGRGEVPDAEWAGGWLRRHRDAIRGHARLLFGRALSRRSAGAACRRWAGTASADLLGQARVVAGPGLGIDTGQWIVARERALDAAGLRDEPEIPPEAATADPWKHGHYA